MNPLNQLSRITSPGRIFIPQIDGLRAVAILAVIAFHVRAICSYHFSGIPGGGVVEGDPVNDAFSIGYLGVQLFFVVSGFILSLPFARQWLCGGEQVGLREYYIRRVTRIEPPYVIHLLFLFLVCCGVLRWLPSHPHLYQNPAWMEYTVSHILSSLAYSNVFICGALPYPNIVLWSLEIEVQFYLLAPFLALLFKIASVRQRRAWIGALILLGPAAVRELLPDLYQVQASLLGHFQFFLAGFLLADFYLLKNIQAESSRNRWWDLVFPTAIASVVLMRHCFFLSVLMPWVLLFCCLAAFCGRGTATLLAYPGITTVGGMCYTIYMYHWLMISLLVRVTGCLQTHILWIDLLVQFALMSVAIILISAVLFILFERPFMRRDWPGRVLSKLHPPRKPSG